MKHEFPNDEIKRKGQHYRINAQEYAHMCQLLGRDPKPVEWALFSALWSEHCSYKSSKVHLRKFAWKHPRVLEAEGENAGVVDLGQGERVAFKMESHNHPSFIEPYQGAATGVGGILRDIFTMGARPIALTDYLCFGAPGADRMKTLVDGVVSGISGYGNCVGVPTVSGQTEFHSGYNRNILVNAMAVGLFRPGDPIALSKAKGPGNWVVYVGAQTGKDGVHGASMASESFDDKSDAKKPNVQIGDPFYEKLLIEACLEILKKNLVVAMQDMGAAGLTSSSFEMSSKGQVGMVMELDRVPLRDSSMTPEEILLSESQERMLLVCEPAKFEEIRTVFARWGLESTKIGEVRAERKVVLKWKGEVLTEIDPDLLVENAPRYERPFQAWQEKRRRGDFTPKTFQQPAAEILPRLMGQLRNGSKEWIYRQYDQRVGLRTARDSRQSVAFLKLPDSGRGLAIAVGCRPAVMRMDARLGAYDSVFYPSLQMALKGAAPLAVTDCLNFGNPERPEIMSEFVASVDAINAASRLVDAPVISGNVSFYNETLGTSIPPTPATGLVGLRADVTNIPWDEFRAADMAVWWLRCPMVRSFHQSAEIVGEESGFDGDFNPEKAAAFIQDLRDLAEALPLASSKAVGKGGLALTLALMSKEGFGLQWQSEKNFSSAEIFSENFYEAVIALPMTQETALRSFLESHQGISEAHRLGMTQPDRLDLGRHGQWSSQNLKEIFEGAWPREFGQM